MATVLGRLVRVCGVDFCRDLLRDTAAEFGNSAIFCGNFPRKYNVLGLTAMDSNTSVKSCSRGDIWLIFSKKCEKSVDIFSPV